LRIRHVGATVCHHVVIIYRGNDNQARQKSIVFEVSFHRNNAFTRVMETTLCARQKNNAFARHRNGAFARVIETALLRVRFPN
jgi:hypothetical protein